MEGQSEMEDEEELEEELEGEEEEEEEEESVPEYVADFDPSDDDISEIEEGAFVCLDVLFWLNGYP